MLEPNFQVVEAQGSKGTTQKKTKNANTWDAYFRNLKKSKKLLHEKVMDKYFSCLDFMKSHELSQKHKRIYKNNKCALQFRKQYPNVMKAIKHCKATFSKECKEGYLTLSDSRGATKDAIQLPHILMRLESLIFTNTLRKLFNKGVKCIGIHDAIAVMDAECSPETITDALMIEYKKVGLLPTLDIAHNLLSA